MKRKSAPPTASSASATNSSTIRRSVSYPRPTEPSLPAPAAAAGALRDAVLLRRVATQEAAALAELYAVWSGPLYSYALRALPTAEDAEDTLQEVFVKIWKRAHTFDPTLSSGFTWAWRITRSHCCDVLRHRGRRAVLHTGPSLDDPASAPSLAAPGLDLRHRDEIRRVVHALDQLSTPERRAVEMAVFLEYTGEEIATELAEPLGTIKSRIRRGLLHLRQILQHHDR
jgi:RNA polymerase sigma-70 factor, ECF subfamily